MNHVIIQLIRWPVIPLTLFISGCASPTAILSPNHPYDFDSFNCRNGDGKENREDWKSGVCADIKQLTDLEASYYNSPAEGRKDIRDQWVHIMTRNIDFMWWKFKNDFFGRTAGARTIIETAATGTGATSAGVTGTGLKSGLAILSATFSSLSTSFDKNVLENQTLPVILSAIEGERAKIDAQITTRLQFDVARYSLAMASRDVMRYANAGAISSAIAKLSSTIGASAKDSEAKRDAAAP